MPEAQQSGYSSRRTEQPGSAVSLRAESSSMQRSVARAALLVGDPRALMAADLVAAGCPVDGRQHLLDERVFAGELLACAGGSVHEPWLGALCGRRLLPDSLLAGPRPICPACVHAALPRLWAARAQCTARRDTATGHRRRLRAVLGWVVSIGLAGHGPDDTSGSGDRYGDNRRHRTGREVEGGGRA